MLSYKQEKNCSTINPSGFTGYIIKNSNVILEDSFIQKGTSFVNVFDNSNALLRDCGSVPPVTNQTLFQYSLIKHKLDTEIGKRLLPFWYHFKLNRIRNENALNYNPQNGIRLSPVIISGNNINRLMNDNLYTDIRQYRDNLINFTLSSESENGIEYLTQLSGLIEKQIIDNEKWDSKDVEYTASGGYYLDALNSSIKAVFPLSQTKTINVDNPDILLNLKNRYYLPIYKDDIENDKSKIYILSGISFNQKIVKYDAFDLPIENFDKEIKQIDTTDNYTNNTNIFIHKNIAESKNSLPIYEKDENGDFVNYQMNYRSQTYNFENHDQPYFEFDSAYLLNEKNVTVNRLFFKGPYTKDNVSYFTVNNDMSTSLNLNGNEALTFYIKYKNNVYSLYDIVNNLLDDSDDLKTLKSNYFSVKNSEINNDHKLYIDLLSVKTDQYQPNGFLETVTFGGFYDNTYKIGTISVEYSDQITGYIYDKYGNNITNDLINEFIESNSGTDTSLINLDEIIDYNYKVDINGDLLKPLTGIVINKNDKTEILFTENNQGRELKIGGNYSFNYNYMNVKEMVSYFTPLDVFRTEYCYDNAFYLMPIIDQDLTNLNKVVIDLEIGYELDRNKHEFLTNFDDYVTNDETRAYYNLDDNIIINSADFIYSGDEIYFDEPITCNELTSYIERDGVRKDLDLPTLITAYVQGSTATGSKNNGAIRTNMDTVRNAIKDGDQYTLKGSSPKFGIHYSIIPIYSFSCSMNVHFCYIYFYNESGFACITKLPQNTNGKVKIIKGGEYEGAGLDGDLDKLVTDFETIQCSYDQSTNVPVTFNGTVYLSSFNDYTISNVNGIFPELFIEFDTYGTSSSLSGLYKISSKRLNVPMDKLIAEAMNNIPAGLSSVICQAIKENCAEFCREEELVGYLTVLGEPGKPKLPYKFNERTHEWSVLNNTEITHAIRMGECYTLDGPLYRSDSSETPNIVYSQTGGPKSAITAENFQFNRCYTNNCTFLWYGLPGSSKDRSFMDN